MQPATAGEPRNYGATSGAPDNGLQKLGADATKIEPKVWLASERTLLSWFRVALLLSSFALALFNSASDRDTGTRAMGVVYAVLALGMLGYAWCMHRCVYPFPSGGGERRTDSLPLLFCLFPSSYSLRNTSVRRYRIVHRYAGSHGTSSSLYFNPN